MFYIYILRSLKDGRTYVGYTNNLQARLRLHNAGKVASTKYRVPLQLIFSESFTTSAEARKRELYWKSGAGRRKLKNLLSSP
ncbi:MAG: GIY-YIG nuclease family protein [Candidatus Paceibacterota bacterium]|nr:MAG: GIY-YIG nuclease family protein [Candidatus Paceibacterota bacterium]